MRIYITPGTLTCFCPLPRAPATGYVGIHFGAPLLMAPGAHALPALVKNSDAQ
jgi:hypothetical protein